jgi:nicotinamidase-related amidase
MTRRVLLVIDMLNDFLDPAGALYCGEEVGKIIPVIRSLIDQFTTGGEADGYDRRSAGPGL